MKAEEFLRAHAQDRHLPTLHDDMNNDELKRLAARFSPEPTAAIDAVPESTLSEQAGPTL